jgi:hypothetical protein
VEFAQRFHVTSCICFREPVPEDPRRVPNCYRKRRHIIGHHRSSTDDRSSSDADSPENDCARSNPNVVTDFDCIFRTGPTVSNPLRQQHRHSDVLHIMICSAQDHHLRARHEEIPDSTIHIDRRAATDCTEVSDLKSVCCPDRRTAAESQTLPNLDLP